MLLHTLKVGVSVIAVATMAYIFYPGGATTKSSPATKPATHNTRSGQAKAVSHNRKSSKQRAKQLAREEPIKPDRALRGAQTHSHGGPPSKMLGGL